MKKFLVVALVSMSLPAWSLDVSSRNGNIVTLALPTYAAAVSYASGDTEGLSQLVQSEAATFVLVSALKSSTHATRPDGSDNKSFPSMHTAASFSAAQYLQMRGGSDMGVPAYLLAGYVGATRVDANKHYWKDVVGGAATGIMTTYYFTDRTNSPKLSLHWRPDGPSVIWQQPLR